MNNPNMYAGLGQAAGIPLLESMFNVATTTVVSEPKVATNSLIPQQYQYQEIDVGAQHAVNLAHQVVTSTDNVQQVVIYQNEDQQQQPISYKIQGMEPQQQQPHLVAEPASVSVQSEAKKDIVAEAIQKENLFGQQQQQSQQAQTQEQGQQQQSEEDKGVQRQNLPTAIKSEPKPGPSKPSSVVGAKSGATSSPFARPRGVARGGRGGYRGGVRQQVMPRIQLLDEEDDGVTCRICLQAFWYRADLLEHLKKTHGITDPERFEREAREKKIRRIREEQQRTLMAKRQRMMAAQGRFLGSIRGNIPRGRGRGRGVLGSLGSKTNGGVRVSSASSYSDGPKPSFQYRDGSFLCDMCNKCFTDGNEMITHWNSCVKKQKQQTGANRKRGGGVAAPIERGRGRGRGRPAGRGRGRGSSPSKQLIVPKTRGRPRGRPPLRGNRGARTHTSSRGRPITKKQAGARGKGKGGKATRKDKGKTRWTGYLIWSTRMRKEISTGNPEMSFQDVSKKISEDWKLVEEEEKKALQEEAEKMNAEGIRKLKGSSDGTKRNSESESDQSINWSDEDDPSFDSKLKTPVRLKIKREAEEDEEALTGEPRSSRKRKRPSFFQEFEDEENNLDKILDDFELEQIEDSKKPRVKKDPTIGPKKPRGPRRKRTPSPESESEPVELETSRSGRVRRKPKFKSFFTGDEGERDGRDEDEEDGSEPDEDFKPDSEPEVEEDSNEDEAVEEIDKDLSQLPPKKRNRISKMSEEEIESATKAAMETHPVVRLDINDIKKEALSKGDGEDVSGEDPIGNVEGNLNDGEAVGSNVEVPESVIIEEMSQQEENIDKVEANREQNAGAEKETAHDPSDDILASDPIADMAPDQNEPLDSTEEKEKSSTACDAISDQAINAEKMIEQSKDADLLVEQLKHSQDVIEQTVTSEDMVEPSKDADDTRKLTKNPAEIAEPNKNLEEIGELTKLSEEGREPEQASEGVVEPVKDSEKVVEPSRASEEIGESPKQQQSIGFEGLGESSKDLKENVTMDAPSTSEGTAVTQEVAEPVKESEEVESSTTLKETSEPSELPKQEQSVVLEWMGEPSKGLVENVAENRDAQSTSEEAEVTETLTSSSASISEKAMHIDEIMSSVASEDISEPITTEAAANSISLESEEGKTSLNNEVSEVKEDNAVIDSTVADEQQTVDSTVTSVNESHGKTGVGSTSTVDEVSQMEEGDEKFRDVIAETQMDNIFN